MTMLKPPISRMGGKSKLRKHIIERIPKHVCYVEVFLGAGWVYFGKETSNTEVINDIDSELVNLFKMIKHHEEEVSRLLEYEIYSRDSFEDYLNQKPEHLTEIQRAVRFLHIIGCSFGAKGKHFGYGATKKPTQKIFNEDLKSIRERLKNTYVENLNFKTLIEKYDREGTFFFCDPPYWKTSGYDNPFTWENHLELKNTLSNIKGRFLLTLNNCPEIRALYKEFNILETEVMYTVSKSGKGIKNHSELIIMNY